MGESHRTQGENADAVGSHREWELPFHMRGATQFEDLHRASSPLSLQHVAENHDIVGNELFHAVTSDGSVLINAFSGHHRGDTNFLQPSNQSENFTTHHKNGVVLLKHRSNGVDDNPLRFVFANRIIDSLNQSREIKAAGHILTIGIRRGIQDEQLVLFHHLLEIPSEAGRIAQDVER